MQVRVKRRALFARHAAGDAFPRGNDHHHCRSADRPIECRGRRIGKALQGGAGVLARGGGAHGSIAYTAARLRARHKLKLPDAIQLASALAINAHALVTHDRDFAKVRGMRIVG